MKSPFYYRNRWNYWRNVLTPLSLLRWRLAGGAAMPAAHRRTIAVRSPGLGYEQVGIRSLTDLETLIGTTLGCHLPEYPLRTEAVIVDLGCNIGLTLLDFAQRYPDARVIGVEMDAHNYDLAVANTRRNPRIEVVHAAISAADGEVSYDASVASNAFSISDAGSGDDRRTVVPALSLDSLRSRYRLPRIDYLKVDIEGAEAVVFGGSMPASAVQAVDQLGIELHGPFTELIRGTLECHGFRVERSRRRFGSLSAHRW